MKRLLIVFILLASSGVASAAAIKEYCSGLPSSDTVQVYVKDLTDAQVDVDWSSTGVSEEPWGNGKSTYWFTVAEETGHIYDVKCRTTIASPAQFVAFGSGGSLTLAEIEASTKLLLKTAGSPTNQVNIDANNKVDSNASVNLTQEDVEAIANAVSGGAGLGDTAVDHNTGGADHLRFVDGTGAGIDNAEIKAFLKTDYDDHHYSTTFIQGKSATGADGRWSWPMMLDRGFTYTIMFYKQGSFMPVVIEVTI